MQRRRSRLFPGRVAAACLAGALGLASCRASETVAPTELSSTTTPVVIQQADIRFGLVGQVTGANVWALFDSKGYSYNNHAVRSATWPRLYSLSIPDRRFEAETAADLPSSVRAEGAFYTASVLIRPGLEWDDGSPFTAEDVAFTVNTALQFELGFDWRDFYNPDWLDHAEAVRPDTVKFFFKREPDSSVWQYGALRAPVVQREFWADKVARAGTLLPSEEMVPEMADLKQKVANLQGEVNDLYAQAVTAQGEAARQVQADLRRKQGNLDQAINDLSKAQDTYDASLAAAREALYTLSDAGEPHLGKWIPVSGDTGNTELINQADAAYPGPKPAFKRAIYHLYGSSSEAAAALADGEIDVVLDPELSSVEARGANRMTSVTRSLRFLVLNARSGTFKDAAIRQALACMLNQDSLVGDLAGGGAALTSFTLPGPDPWTSPEAALPCSGLDSSARLNEATTLLREAGYGWGVEPSTERAGQDLKAQDGNAIAPMVLMYPAGDELRQAAANYVEKQANALGISLAAKAVTADAIDYAVFSSGQFAAAVVGWQASAYPGYLCNWFGRGGPFEFGAGTLVAACGELSGTTEPAAAKEMVAAIQGVLANEVPMVPLFAVTRTDAYRHVAYPFDSVLDGLPGAFGAPSLAVSAEP